MHRVQDLICKHRLLMIMKVSYHLDTIRLHIYNRYAPGLLSVGTAPLLSAALEYAFKNVRISLVKYMMTLLCRHTLDHLVTYKFTNELTE